MAAPEGKKGLLVDVGTGILRRDHVLVQRAPGAVVVLGYGPRAELLRRFACEEAAGDGDPFIARCNGIARAIESGQLAKARQSGVPRSVLEIKDRTLRRLAIAEALAKAGFNPDEPRDERGRWTSEGGGAGEAGRPERAGVQVLRPRLRPWLQRPNGRSAAMSHCRRCSASPSWRRAFRPAEFSSAPTSSAINRTYKTQGIVPDQPDITWEYDQTPAR